MCSLCRRPIPFGYLESAEVLSKVRSTIGQLTQSTFIVTKQASQELSDTPPLDVVDQQWQWFYEGRLIIIFSCIRIFLNHTTRNGWWRFESRNNEELEEAFSRGQQQVITLRGK